MEKPYSVNRSGFGGSSFFSVLEAHWDIVILTYYMTERRKTSASKGIVTLRDIAREAGVSVNAVSCALRDSRRVSRAVKERINEIAIRLGYVPNAAARTLRIGKSKVVGVVITDISNPVFGMMVKGIESTIKKRDYAIIIGNTDEDSAMEERAVATMVGKGVDGVIITPAQRDTTPLRALKRAGIPFILMGRRFNEAATNYVVSDDYRGGYLAGEYLLSKGHRRMVLVNGPHYISSSTEREEGFTSALAKAGLEPVRIEHIPPEMNEAHRLMTEILGSSLDFTAVFCFDDYTAFGVIKAAQAAGRRVPQDIAVIGYDNTAFAEMLDMGLTSVDMNERRIGELAAELIIEIIEADVKREKGDSIVLKQVILEPNLVIRGSA